MGVRDERDDEDPGATDPGVTKSSEPERRDDAGDVRRFRLSILEGSGVGTHWSSRDAVCTIGSHPSNDLVLDDETVSRFHCEIRIGADGTRICDVGSRNGTVVDGVPVVEAFVRGGSTIRLGKMLLRFGFDSERNRLPVSPSRSFGTLVGTSVAMRTSFAMLERAADSDATVLIEGETGTGKEGAAAGVHRASARRDGPFVVVDCSAIPENLLESELFGHERGAFTGAAQRRVGAFEEASGGTIFLDEIGELPLSLQPKLLRVLEQRQIRRVGSNGYQDVDVRVIAATNRDLRADVNSGTFRPDVYFRLAVVRVPLPPLRQRLDDLPILVEKILRSLCGGEAVPSFVTAEFIAALRRSSWPGNVRELRNYLERCLVFREAVPFHDERSAAVDEIDDDEGSLAYDEARRRALAEFERRYLHKLLEQHNGKVAQAAQTAGVDRVYLYRLMRRHGIKSQTGS